MSSESHDPLIDLADALDVDPSPAFAARVRRRVETAHSAPARRWRVAAAAITGAGLVTGMAVVTMPQGRRPMPAPVVAERVEPPTIAEPAHPLALAAPPRPAEQAARTRATVVPGVRRASLPAPQPREPEVLVSPDQRLALDQLRAALADGRLDSTVLPANLIGAPAQISPAPTEASDSLGGERANPNLMRRLEAPRRFVGRVVRTTF